MANALRALAMDAVEAAQSGHPGMPMGMADTATVLFTQFLNFDAQHPDWPDRDRFILSAGHGSMLLYGLLYLLGYPGMTLEEIKRFRKLGSRTPGHSEFGHQPGIETTAGPLGQGFANAVGFALAERMLNARFGDKLVDHRTYVIASDGDLMEGVSHEAASLAGHLKLAKLIVLFDDNSISIDGPTRLAVSDDALGRFRSYGWAARAVDGHDPAAVALALREAQASDRPSLIACRTVIGFGAPKKQGTEACHGAPLGKDEVAAAKQALGWTAEPFVIPAPILDHWRAAGRRGAARRAAWSDRLASSDAATRAEFERRLSGRVPPAVYAALKAHADKLTTEKPKMATRKASEAALKIINPLLPETVGGSADLTGSTLVKTPDMTEIAPGRYDGRFIHYGVREHAMLGAMNGLARHGGFIPYGGTFLVFADYCRPAIRLAALMGLKAIYVFTHDSIGVGEDGPTHEPVEHLAALRAMPNLNVFRPADAVETAECWAAALASENRPSLIALTRQNVSAVRMAPSAENLCLRGAYELAPAKGAAKVTLLATGSEVEIALGAKSLLDQKGVPARVVSMPCWSLFEEQSSVYRDQVLQPATLRVAVEAGVSLGWERYIGERGAFVGMTGYGASAPYADLYKHFAITAEAVASAALARL
jgi:transketolase